MVRPGQGNPGGSYGGEAPRKPSDKNSGSSGGGSSSGGDRSSDNPNTFVQKEYERRTKAGKGGGNSGDKIITVDDAVQAEKARLLQKYPGSEKSINEANIRQKILQQRQGPRPEDIYPAYTGPDISGGMKDIAKNQEAGYYAEDRTGMIATSAGPSPFSNMEGVKALHLRNQVEFGGGMAGELRPEAAMRQGFEHLFESHAAREGGTMRSYDFHISGAISSQDLGKIPEGLEVNVTPGYEMVPGSFNYDPVKREGTWQYRTLPTAPAGKTRESEAQDWRNQGVYERQDELHPPAKDTSAMIPSGMILQKGITIPAGFQVAPGSVTVDALTGKVDYQITPDMRGWDAGADIALESRKWDIPLIGKIEDPLLGGIYREAVEKARGYEIERRLALVYVTSESEREDINKEYQQKMKNLSNPLNIKVTKEEPGRYSSVLERLSNTDLPGVDVDLSPGTWAAIEGVFIGRAAGKAVVQTLGRGLVSAVGAALTGGGKVAAELSVGNLLAEKGAKTTGSPAIGLGIGLLGMYATHKGIGWVGKSSSIPKLRLDSVEVNGVDINGGKSWNGLSLERGTTGRPIIGVAGKRVVLGKPEATLSDIFQDSTPKNSAVELDYMKSAREVMGETQRVTVPKTSLQGLDFAEVRHIPAEYAEPIANWLKGQRDYLIYGSSAQKVQMGEGMMRLPKDIDLMMPNAIQRAQEITSILNKRGGPEVAIFPEESSHVMVKSGGGWSGMLDIHEKGSLEVTGKQSPPDSQAWGFRGSGKTVTVEGYKFRALSDEGLAKGRATTIPSKVGQPITPTETTMLENLWPEYVKRGGEFGPEHHGMQDAHRLKDVGDFSNIQEVLIEYGGKQNAKVPLKRFQEAADIKFEGAVDETGFKYNLLRGDTQPGERFYIASESRSQELFSSTSSSGAGNSGMAASIINGGASSGQGRSPSASPGFSESTLMGLSDYSDSVRSRERLSGSTPNASSPSTMYSAASSSSSTYSGLSSLPSTGSPSSRPSRRPRSGGSSRPSSPGSSELSGISSGGSQMSRPSSSRSRGSYRIKQPGLDYTEDRGWAGIAGLGDLSGRERKKRAKYSEDINPILSSRKALRRFIIG